MNNDINHWKELKGVITPGGDPAYICPVCHNKKSIHLYGVENTENYTHKCCVCHRKLLYPWENEDIQEKMNDFFENEMRQFKSELYKV